MNKLKEIRFIREIAKPFTDRKKKSEHEYYLRTPDHFYLQTLKGIHEGKRCFIIGNGPSLQAEDLDKLKGEYTFAANRIFNIFDRTDWRPTYYICVDDRVLKDVQPVLFNYDLGHMFVQYGECKLDGPTNKLTRIYDKSLVLLVDKNHYSVTSLYVSEDVSHHFCDGGTVTFCAMQLAAYMGFKEIYLLGIDHNFSKSVDASGTIHEDKSVTNYFDNKTYSNLYPYAFDTVNYAYTIMKEYGETHGIKICNATRGGKLEIYPRVEFDSLFQTG